MGVEPRKIGKRNQPGMRFGNKAQHRGNSNVGMADTVAEPIIAWPCWRDQPQGQSITAAICARQRLTQTSDTSLCIRFS